MIFDGKKVISYCIILSVSPITIINSQVHIYFNIDGHTGCCDYMLLLHYVHKYKMYTKLIKLCLCRFPNPFVGQHY